VLPVRKKSREDERGKELAIKKVEKKERKGRLKSPTPCLTWLSEIP
jgi:hypothetical protein